MMKGKDSKALIKILVPIDFSETSIKAMNYAVSLAKTLNSEVVLYHSIDIPVVASGDMVVVADFTQLENDAKVELEKLKLSALSKNDKLRISFQYSTGVSSQEILKKSVEEDIDLIIMGSNGKSGLVETVMGSVTKNVMTNCTCPVLTVPINTLEKYPEKVVFATNFDEHELQALFLLAELLRPFNSEIHLVHIGEYGDMKHQDQLLAYFRGQVRTNINYEKIFYHLLGGKDIESAIEKFIIENKIDWLAIAKRKRNFFDRFTTQSLTNHLHQHSSVPMLVFHTVTKSGTPLF